MDIFSLPPLALAFIVATFVVTVIGICAGLHAWARIHKEIKHIQRAEIALDTEDAWGNAYPHEKSSLDSWLRNLAISTSSHLSDYISTCWSAWLGGRPASLTELHVLVARRERTHVASRLSAGIAALLLVLGIVGTLSAIKPVLAKFSFSDGQVASDQSTDYPREANAIETSAEHVDNLVKDLGNAFWPSLIALGGTILVVFCRGLYALSLNRFTLDLDRIAVNILIPRYRVPSLSEQYQQVKDSLSIVTYAIQEREKNFHEAVNKLEGLVTSISPALGGLEHASITNNEASKELANSARSLSEILMQRLGEESPICKGISAFSEIYGQTGDSLRSLQLTVTSIAESHNETQGALITATTSLAESVKLIARENKQQSKQVFETINQFNGSLSQIPDSVRTTAEAAVSSGIDVIRDGVDSLNDRQQKFHSDVLKKFSDDTKVELDRVNLSASLITKSADKLESSANQINDIKKKVEAGIDGLVKAGKSSLDTLEHQGVKAITSASEKLNTAVFNTNEGIKSSSVSVNRGDIESGKSANLSQPTLSEDGYRTKSELKLPSPANQSPSSDTDKPALPDEGVIDELTTLGNDSIESSQNGANKPSRIKANPVDSKFPKVFVDAGLKQKPKPSFFRRIMGSNNDK